jgi:hypothetical protein
MVVNMYKFLKRILVFSILVLTAFIFNISFIPDFLSIIDFSTKDGDFQYRVIPQKGRDVELMELNFGGFKERNKIENDSVYLFRITKKEWNRAGNWYSYLTDEHWQYEYMQVN